MEGDQDVAGPAMARMQPDDDAVASALGQWRDHETIGEIARRPTLAASATAYLLAVGFVALATALAATTAQPGMGRVVEFGALVALYVAAYRVEFQASAGSMVPTQPVLVALIVTGPTQLVPLAVLAGVLLGSMGAPETEAGWYGRAVRVIPAWHSLGPVAVLLGAGVTDPGPGNWPVLLLALVAQFLLDAGTAALRMASMRIDPRVLVRPLAWTFRVDALMAVIGAGPVFCAAGAPRGVVVPLVATPVVLVRMLGRDRTEHVQQARSLGAAFASASVEATSDPLTGLGNRRRWQQAVDDAQAGGGGGSGAVTVVAADLDGLKHANDTYGHEVGDALIAAFATVLADVAPAGATVARLGGDEFAVLVAGDRACDGEVLVRRIRERVRDTDPIGGARLSASLGWASCPPAPSVAEAVRAADAAAGEDKRHRRVGRRTDPPRPPAPRAPQSPDRS